MVARGDAGECGWLEWVGNVCWGVRGGIKGEGERERGRQRYIELSQHDVQLPPPPRRALAHVLRSHRLRPQRQVPGRVRPHVGAVAGAVVQGLQRREEGCGVVGG